MTILNKFKRNGDKWEDGEILDPGNGKVYTASIWLISNDELRVRGFLGPFYRTQTWKRLRSDTSNLQSSQ
jgi:uncharacterized protein (DUF2147 family)